MNWAAVVAAVAAAATAAGGNPAAPAPPASDAQLAGQLVAVGFSGTAVPPALARSIRRGETGAVILMGANVTDRRQVARLTAALQAITRPAAVDRPLLIMVDQEGGAVRRIAGPPSRSAAAMGQGSVAATTAEGRATGALLRRLGVGAALAPVADVARPGAALARHGRIFATAPGPVAAHAAGFAAGLRAAGVLASAKHFPGLGAARVNTDDAPVTIRRPRAELERVDLAPFRVLVRREIPLVMTASAAYPALGAPGPALLSRRVVTGLLRQRIGFSGVIITDALDTPALGAVGADGAVARRAVRAGNDLLLYIDPARGAAAVRAVRAGLRAGTIDRVAAGASLQRLLTLRARIPGPTVAGATIPSAPE